MTESLDELRKLHKGFIFWVRSLYGFISGGLILLGIYFFGGITKNVFAEPLSYASQSDTPWENGLPGIDFQC